MKLRNRLLILLAMFSAGCGVDDTSPEVETPVVESTRMTPTEPPGATAAAEVSTPSPTDAAPVEEFEPVELAGREIWRWFYMIDVNLEAEMADQIVASTYDMVVLDLIPLEANNTDFPMGELVERLHKSDHPKLVLAYIDIGQAEDFRVYWRPGWEVGDPEWIAGTDPDGWEGNYPVAYWYDEWWDIWLGKKGSLQTVLDLGFDGVYLDWVEAYSDETVVEFARRDGVDPQQEMIWFVAEIGHFGRAQNPDFLVIAQNAAELARIEAYRNAIDAIAQEQVWFDGAADDDPPGDCPLPRTEELVDTAKYRNSLTPDCLELFVEFPDSTLHVSSESYLADLEFAQSHDIPIFTIDYAVQPENIHWVYEASRAHGFIPFVSNRALDSFVAPTP
jgi:cysteinyl-tRNA synthetase